MKNVARVTYIFQTEHIGICYTCGICSKKKVRNLSVVVRYNLVNRKECLMIM